MTALSLARAPPGLPAPTRPAGRLPPPTPTPVGGLPDELLGAPPQPAPHPGHSAAAGHRDRRRRVHPLLRRAARGRRPTPGRLGPTRLPVPTHHRRAAGRRRGG